MYPKGFVSTTKDSAASVEPMSGTQVVLVSSSSEAEESRPAQMHRHIISSLFGAGKFNFVNIIFSGQYIFFRWKYSKSTRCHSSNLGQY